MNNIVIVDAIRTPIGKLGGTIGNETVDKLGAHVIKSILEKNNLEGKEIDEVIMGQAKQNSDVSNLARVALLRAGLPNEVPGYTIHRQCGSGVQAINSSAQQIQLGLSDIIIAGGAESMSTAPYYVNNVRFGIKAGNVELKDPNTASQPGSQPIEQYGNLSMGITAENIAEKYNISRNEQDEFSLKSQEKAKKAIENGLFDTEIEPLIIKSRKSEINFQYDEHPRNTSLEKLGSLKPVFKVNGTVTAGNASGRNDGAAALLVMPERIAKKHDLKGKVRVISQASVGVPPEIMGIGPVNASLKALKLAGLAINDIGVIELNEAFASQAIACINELGIDSRKVNPNGGAIALGHPVGATGAILMTKLIHELERTGEKYGLVALCIGGGMGIATIVENMNV